MDSNYRADIGRDDKENNANIANLKTQTNRVIKLTESSYKLHKSSLFGHAAKIGESNECDLFEDTRRSVSPGDSVISVKDIYKKYNLGFLDRSVDDECFDDDTDRLSSISGEIDKDKARRVIDIAPPMQKNTYESLQRPRLKEESSMPQHLMDTFGKQQLESKLFLSKSDEENRLLMTSEVDQPNESSSVQDKRDTVHQTSFRKLFPSNFDSASIQIKRQGQFSKPKLTPPPPPPLTHSRSISKRSDARSISNSPAPGSIASSRSGSPSPLSHTNAQAYSLTPLSPLPFRSRFTHYLSSASPRPNRPATSNNATLLPDTLIYSGPLLDNLYHGFGHVMTSGSMKTLYQGGFQKGLFSGFGTLMNPSFLGLVNSTLPCCNVDTSQLFLISNGARFTSIAGFWESGLLHGCSTITFDDGGVWEGEWQSGQAHGWGVLRGGKHGGIIGRWELGRLSELM